MKIVSILGARPQFIKASPLSLELRRAHKEILVHTGQHYDYGMSAVFFEELGLPEPDYNLGVGSGTHGAQTGAILSATESVLLGEGPDIVVVYGDTNSTIAGALAAAKLRIPVAHVEAGLRSFNRDMPEEINRILTDHVSEWLFAPTDKASRQLESEGLRKNVHVVGDVMYDALLMHQCRAMQRSRYPGCLGLGRKEYYACTIHRAENTDSKARLAQIFSGIQKLDKTVVIPLHPRTRKKLAEYRIEPGTNTLFQEPLGYLDMLQLQRQACCVLTDSGGVQKESYYLGVPCVTLRSETEWAETVEAGWNAVCGTDHEAILEAVARFKVLPDAHPELFGSGNAAARISAILAEAMG